MAKCGQPTLKGTPCRWDLPCKVHEVPGSPIRPVSSARPASSVPPALAEHNLRALAWWLAESVLRGEVERDVAGVLVSIMRILASMDGEDVTPAGLRAETIVRARAAFGMPPENDEQWAAAERYLDPETFAEIKRQVREADERAARLDAGLADRDEGDGLERR